MPSDPMTPVTRVMTDPKCPLHGVFLNSTVAGNCTCPPPLTDPVRCGICGGFWDFGSTWLGQIVAIHPVGKCIPKPLDRYVECSVCEGAIRLELDSGYRQRLFWCSEECREVLRARRRKAQAQACKRFAIKQRRLNRIYRADAA